MIRIASRRGVRIASSAALALSAFATVGTAGTPAATASVPSTCARPPDTVPPRITSFAFTPHVVDVTHGAKNVTVTVKAQDFAAPGKAVSGVTTVSVVFGSTRVSAAPGYTSAAGLLTLVSGSHASGTWRGNVVMRPFAQAGAWVVFGVIATDAAGNTQGYPAGASNGPANLTLRPSWDNKLTVKSGSDTSAPKLAAFTFSPTSVNSTSAAKQVGVTATVTDAGSGVAAVGVNFADSALNAGFGGAITHQSGNKWTGNVTVPRWSKTGSFKTYVTLQDKAGNADLVTPDQLAKRGFRHQLQVTSGTDSTPPTLKSFHFTPAAVDVRTAAKNVSMTGTVTDSQSGAANFLVTFTNSAGPYPAIYGFLSKTHSGGWKGVLHVPACVQPGTYVASVTVYDAHSNYRTYSTSDLTSMHMSHNLQVTSHLGDLAGPNVDSAQGTVSTHSVRVHFDSGVLNVSASTLTLYKNSDYSAPIHVSGVACENASSATTPCSGAGAGGLVTTATLSVPSLVGSVPYIIWANQNSVRVQLTDAARNPASWSGEVDSFAAT